MRNRKIFGTMLGIAMAALPAYSQDSESPQRSEVSIQALGSFVKSTTSNGVEQNATNSGGVLASYRYFFNEYNGVEMNYGYAQNTQSYGLGGGPLGLKTNSHEATAAYIFRLPLRHWSPFVLAGAGGLVFDPKDFAGASAQARAAFVYGGGADFNFSKHVFLRAEYRGFVYNSPTYDVPAMNGLDRITHRAEPSVGFGYRF